MPNFSGGGAFCFLFHQQIYIVRHVMTKNTDVPLGGWGRVVGILDCTRQAVCKRWFFWFILISKNRNQGFFHVNMPVLSLFLNDQLPDSLHIHTDLTFKINCTNLLIKCIHCTAASNLYLSVTPVVHNCLSNSNSSSPVYLSGI